MKKKFFQKLNFYLKNKHNKNFPFINFKIKKKAFKNKIKHGNELSINPKQNKQRRKHKPVNAFRKSI